MANRKGAQGLSRIARQCAAQGLRMTPQRKVIAEVLEHSKDHPDVEELYRRVSRVDAGISLSTVYRTLKLFESKGILERHDFGTGRGVYELAERQHHDHLIDVKSGKVIEFHNADIEALQDAIARELGYRLIGHRHELFGTPLATKKKK